MGTYIDVEKTETVGGLIKILSQFPAEMMLECCMDDIVSVCKVDPEEGENRKAYIMIDGETNF